jgi:outer membrane protein W
MNRPRLTVRLLTVSSVVASAAVALSAASQENDQALKLFGAAVQVMPRGESAVAGVASSVKAADELGFELGAEWKPSQRIGIEASYLTATHDVEANGTPIGDIELRPLTVALNFHVLRRDNLSWYVGPTVAYIDWSGLELAGGAVLDVDGETTFGATTGVDIDLGERLALQLGLRWLDAAVESPALPSSVSVDPLFMRVGVAARF